MIVVIVTVVTVVVIVTSFSKNNLTPQQHMRYSQGSFSQFSRCFSLNPTLGQHIHCYTSHITHNLHSTHFTTHHSYKDTFAGLEERHYNCRFNVSGERNRVERCDGGVPQAQGFHRETVSEVKFDGTKLWC